MVRVIVLCKDVRDLPPSIRAMTQVVVGEYRCISHENVLDLEERLPALHIPTPVVQQDFLSGLREYFRIKY